MSAIPDIDAAVGAICHYPCSVLVATHNLMHGRRLDDLVHHYRVVRERHGLDVLCVQENRCPRDGAHSTRIASALGSDYRELSDSQRCGKGIVFDGNRLRCVHHQLHELPVLGRLSWIERRYIAGGVPDRRFVQVARFADALERTFTVVNFHLDTAGGNQHRRRQVESIAALLAEVTGPLVVCGDTNAFTFLRRRQQALLHWMLEPLAAFGAVAASHGPPTHFFARQDEPHLGHRLVATLGRLGLEWPLRYDVVCTNVEVAERGVRVTPESDHELVWASLRL